MAMRPPPVKNTRIHTPGYGWPPKKISSRYHFGYISAYRIWVQYYYIARTCNVKYGRIAALEVVIHNILQLVPKQNVDYIPYSIPNNALLRLR